PRNENYWNVNLSLGQLGLKIEPAQARQSDIQYQTARSLQALIGQKLRRGAHHHSFQSDRLQQRLHTLAHIGVVIDDVHDLLDLVCHDQVPRLLVGRTRWNMEPPRSPAETQIRPS